MGFKKMIVLEERDLLVDVAANSSVFIGHHKPFGYKVDELNVCAGILAPISGVLDVEAVNGVNGWHWKYVVKLGEEWEYTSRDEFTEVEERISKVYRKTNYSNTRAIPSSRIKSRDPNAPDADRVKFSLPVEHLAMACYPGLELRDVMHKAGIPIVALQHQIVGPAWGKLRIEAVEDIDGWHYHFDWDGQGQFEEGMRVAGQDAIDNWRSVHVQHLMRKAMRRNPSMDDDREREMFEMFSRNRPMTTTDELGRIVDIEPQVDYDDDEL